MDNQNQFKLYSNDRNKIPSFFTVQNFFLSTKKKLEQENRFSAYNLAQKQPKNALFNFWLPVTFNSVDKKKVPSVKSLI